MDSSSSVNATPSIVNRRKKQTMQQYRWVFYIMNEDGDLKEEKASCRWFFTKPHCLKDAGRYRTKLPILVDDSERYVRKVFSRTLVLRKDDKKRHNQLNVVERIFIIVLSELLNNLIKHISYSRCPECDDCLEHQKCLDLELQVRDHFLEALDILDLDHVIRKWSNTLDYLNVRKDVHPMYLMKYNSRDWIQARLRNDEFHEHLKGTIVRLD